MRRIVLAAALALTAGTSRASTPADSIKLPTLDSVAVVRLRVLGNTGDTAAFVAAGMGEIVQFFVHDLRSLNSRSTCVDTLDRAVSGCTIKKIGLYLDGREIPGLHPESNELVPPGRDGILQFHLVRADSSDEAWADLLGAPRVGEPLFDVPVTIGVGLHTEGPVGSRSGVDQHFRLTRIHPRRFAIGVVLLIALVALFFYYAYTTDLVRDLGPSATKGTKPFSLGRCQMAWWFFLVFVSFGFIYLITGAFDTITTSVLALLGISATTFVGAASIDAGALTQKNVAVNDLKAKQAALDAEVAGARARMAVDAAATATVAAKTTERSLVAAQLATEAGKPAPTSLGFWKDLVVDDSGGQSFHRFQMIAWTVALGIVFLVGVWSRLAMPSFSGTLLGLVGITSGTYLGFKFPEQKS